MRVSESTQAVVPVTDQGREANPRLHGLPTIFRNLTRGYRWVGADCEYADLMWGANHRDTPRRRGDTTP